MGFTRTRLSSKQGTENHAGSFKKLHLLDGNTLDTLLYSFPYLKTRFKKLKVPDSNFFKKVYND